MGFTSPLIELTAVEIQYWHMLQPLKTAAWEEADNLVGCIMCRDLAIVDRLLWTDEATEHLVEAMKRVHEGAQLLGLDREKLAVDDWRSKALAMILDGPQ